MTKALGWTCFPWWVDDWRSSSARARLSLAGRSAYMDLCGWYWTLNRPDTEGAEGGAKREQNGSTLLPDDDAVLARYLGVSVGEWLEVRDEVIACFERHPDGFSHPRVDREIEYKLNKSRGGKARWSKTGAEGGANEEQTGEQIGSPHPHPHDDDIHTSISSKSRAEREHAATPAKDEVIRRWNEELAPLVGAPGIREIKGTRAKALKARLREDPAFLDAVADELPRMRQDAIQLGFLTFDWLLRPANLTKFCEGSYRNRHQVQNDFVEGWDDLPVEEGKSA